MPVETLGLVSKNHAGGLPRKRHFERITLDLGGDGTTQDQAGSAIVACRTQDDSRAVLGLFATGLRIEMYPHDITGVWNVSH